MLPDPIRAFIEVFSHLPSIGTRQATRLAFLLIRGGKAKIEEVARAASDLRLLKTCSRCFFVHSNENTLCDICQNPKRNQKIVMIVERETDLISIEKTRRFTGRYLVLGESPKSGILESDQKLRLGALKSALRKESGKAEEIIIGFNPTTYGDVNAAAVAKELEGAAEKITRLGRGIPTGGEIEFADEETLGAALERRI